MVGEFVPYKKIDEEKLNYLEERDLVRRLSAIAYLEQKNDENIKCETFFRLKI